MKKALIKTLTFCLVTAPVFFTICCTSIPKEIPADMSLEGLKKSAYDCEAVQNFKGAEKYYNAIIERYGTNIEVLIGAEFEIGHIYIKQKNYKEAKPYLDRVVSYYSYGDNSLPAQYLKLANLDLDKIQAYKDKKAKKIKNNKKKNE
ncbi:MAG: tetratricopeptide repeat protein [Treponemataceae bacterium]